MLRRVLNLVLFLIVVQLILAPQTYAYLDPGSGSYACQFLLAALVGGLFLLKAFWGRIASALAHRQKSRDE